MAVPWKILAVLVSSCLLQSAVRAETDNPDAYRLSDPVTHRNLAIYLVHGTSRGGPVPLTLQEAMARKAVEVREIGRVNELQVENVGDEEVFIQAGDIVKGGQQDRVLSVSLLLPPRSGATSVASVCVESGRWSARAGEDVRMFSLSNALVPSRQTKLELAGVGARPPEGAPPSRQQEVWKSVSRIQDRLSSNLAPRWRRRARARACSCRWRTGASSASRPSISRRLSRSPSTLTTSSAMSLPSTAR